MPETPSEYYKPPPEWRYDAIKERYERLARVLKVKAPLKIEYRYSSDLMNVKYVLLDISEGIKVNDAASIEIAADFIIAPVYFHYSGYIRTTMARRLKHPALSEAQRDRIVTGFLTIFESEKFGRECGEFVKLLNHIGLGKRKAEYEKKLCTGHGKKQQVAKALGLCLKTSS